MDSCVYALIMADVHPSKKYRQIQSVVKANKVSYAIVRVAPRIPLEFDNRFFCLQLYMIFCCHKKPENQQRSCCTIDSTSHTAPLAALRYQHNITVYD